MNQPDKRTTTISLSNTVITIRSTPHAHRESYSLCIPKSTEEAPLPHELFEDLTENIDAVLSFAKLLSDEEVSPHHLADIIEDALPLK